MTDRLQPMATDELEARLADLASVLAFPPTPDLATAVGSRLRARPVAGASPTGTPRRLPVRRSVPRSLLLAATVTLLVVGGALAVRYGLELLSIDFGPLPSVPASPSAPPPGSTGEGLGLGERLALEQARAAAPFDILQPSNLGAPDAIYVGGAALRGQVAMVYSPRAGLPASDLLNGAGLLVTQNRGRQDAGLAHKLLQNSLATVEAVTVDGAPGAWISGQPHFFWYLSPEGFHIEESRRLVGNTLAWERDGILYRIEGAITLEQALEIAGSMR